MSRRIECYCGKYLGEIRDATLAKGIVYKCRECSLMAPNPKHSKPEIVNDIFGSFKPKWHK